MTSGKYPRLKKQCKRCGEMFMPSSRKPLYCHKCVEISHIKYKIKQKQKSIDTLRKKLKVLINDKNI